MAVPVEIRRRNASFEEREPGRLTQHAFSFGSHYDPERLRFGPMVCHDDHRLARGKGFLTHRHSGLEIVTWVVAGALAHTDSTGRTTVVEPGSVAVLSARSGVEHSEVAAAPQTRFVQVWLASDAEGDPTYDVRPVELAAGTLTPVVAPLPGATFSVARLQPGQSVVLPAAPRQHVFVATGALTRSSLAEPLSAGDAFLMTEHPATEVTAGGATDLLVWSFDS